MLSIEEVKTMKFETSVEEIIEAGANAIAKMMRNDRDLMEIVDELETLVAATAAEWVINKEKKED